MERVTLKQLLAAGAHFGHLTRRWNPKMKPFIFTEKNGIHIIDIKKTVGLVEKAQNAVSAAAARGEDVLFVGTKKQAKEIVKNEADRAGAFYIDERWLGGTLTNFATIKKSIRHLKDLEKKGEDGTYEKITKKEILMIEREKEKMRKVLAGIENMKRLPGIIFIVDIKKENIAVKEAKKLNIPLVAMVDTNVDPAEVDFPIPANDDASHSIALITKAMADAAIEGKQSHQAAKADKEEEERIAESKKEKESVKEEE
jgi:small subunit ribosomal protein S2